MSVNAIDDFNEPVALIVVRICNKRMVLPYFSYVRIISSNYGWFAIRWFIHEILDVSDHLFVAGIFSWHLSEMRIRKHDDIGRKRKNIMIRKN